MKNKDKIILFLVIITIVVISSLLIFMIVSKNKTTDTLNYNTVENEIINNIVEEKENEIEENVITEENNVEQENTNSTQINEQQASSEEITKEEVETIKTNDEKAIEIARKDWGEDSKVVFVNDGTSKSTGRYIVAVRDATTRNAICYYHIDVNTGEFKVEN